MKKTLAGLTIVFLSCTSFGSIEPHQYFDPARKLVIKSAGTEWNFFGADDISSKSAGTDLQLQFVARSPKIIENKLQPVLTMRVDPGHWKSARQYAEKWLKEFPKFGYELHMSREARFGSLSGFEMELSSTVSDRQIRQLVVKEADEMWIFTCSANTKYFRSAWKACEKILNTAQFR